MIELQVTLSPGAADFIDQQLATGQFSTPSEVVSRTLEQALEQQSRQRLRELLCAGLASGQGTLVKPEVFAARRAELLARLPPGTSE